MENPRIAVTGMGVVSPFGRGLATYWEALASGASALRPIEGFDAAAYRSPLGAEVPREIYRDDAGRAAMGAPEEDAAWFLALAAEEALADAGLGPVFADEDRVGCVLGSLCGGYRNLARAGAAYVAGRPPETSVASTSVHYQLDFIARRHNLTGPSTLVSTACASTTDAIGLAADLLRDGQCERVLAGGGDVLGEAIHGGFNALFSITTTTPRPFTRERDGFVIGEGAGVLILETLASARARGARIYAEILGYGLSNTAYHITATSEDGAGEALSLRRALADAALTPADIDYINTHGTATRHNDGSELRAIRSVFGPHTGRLYANANKAAIGHCMGAAGVMEAIATVLALAHGVIPPTPFTAADEADLDLDLVRGEARTAPIRRALSESFGFGGACSAVVFGRAPQ